MITLQREKLQDILEEFKELYTEHFKVTASHQDEFPPDTDWDGYINLENMNMLWLVCVRDEDRLVGYMWFLTPPNLNWKNTRTSIVEKYYVSKEYWGQGLGTKLLEEVETWCREMGIARAFGGTKISQGAAPVKMMEKAGYTPIETNWEKVL